LFHIGEPPLVLYKVFPWNKIISKYFCLTLHETNRVVELPARKCSHFGSAKYAHTVWK